MEQNKPRPQKSFNHMTRRIVLFLHFSLDVSARLHRMTCEWISVDARRRFKRSFRARKSQTQRPQSWERVPPRQKYIMMTSHACLTLTRTVSEVSELRPREGSRVKYTLGSWYKIAMCDLLRHHWLPLPDPSTAATSSQHYCSRQLDEPMCWAWRSWRIDSCWTKWQLSQQQPHFDGFVQAVFLLIWTCRKFLSFEPNEEGFPQSMPMGLILLDAGRPFWQLLQFATTVQ